MMAPARSALSVPKVYKNLCKSGPFPITGAMPCKAGFDCLDKMEDSGAYIRV